MIVLLTSASAPGACKSGCISYELRFKRIVMRCIFAAVLTFISILFTVAVHGLDFVAHGALRHEQYGKNPRLDEFHFTVRSQSNAWAISLTPRTYVENNYDEIQAVGNEQGGFISMDLRKSIEKRRLAGLPVGSNTSVVVIMTNVIPNLTSVPELGPLWLVYLSASYFKQNHSERIPVPFSLNVVGCSILPTFAEYQLRTFWRCEEHTGLPGELICIDDEYWQGILNETLVKGPRYPNPYNNGFTNLVFRVTEYIDFQHQPMPRKALLEIYWIHPNSKSKAPEIIHRCTIESNKYEISPATPIPEPTPSGIASVVDGRTTTSNGPVLLSYMATNRFLDPEELKQLPGFLKAFDKSLHKKPPAMPRTPSESMRQLVIVMLFMTLLAFPILFFWYKGKYWPG